MNITNICSCLNLVSLVVIFSVFPSSCTSYLGLQSLNCYRNIWQAVGCVNMEYLDGLTDNHNVLESLNLM